MDAGGRATHGAVAERVGVRRIKIRKKALFDPPHPNLLPEGEGTVHP
jgi:hypothetical protein